MTATDLLISPDSHVQVGHDHAVEGFVWRM